MNSSVAKTVPPEASHPYLDGGTAYEGEDAFRRFAELVDSEVSWLPDDVPQPRLHEDESILLEIRGITSHQPQVVETAKVSVKQAEFWQKQTAHKFSVAAKLRQIGADAYAKPLEECHTRYTIAQCSDCNRVYKFPNRCDLFYCPECQPGLSNDRKRQVEWWTQLIHQPKHVVLTVKNTPELTGQHVDEFRAWFSKLRRRKFARNWIGGFYSIEVTNEGKGWHLHLHALIEAKWIDSAELALQWDSITNGLGRIVHVKDARNANYLQEVIKYAVKGNQLAAWQPDVILTFIKAFQGKRTFGVFGKLYGARTEFAEFIATLKASRPKCECGSCNVRYFDELEWLSQQHISHAQQPRSPPQFHDTVFPFASQPIHVKD